MALYNDVWREINAADCSTCRDGNRTKVNDSSSFKAMPINRQERINKKIEDAELKNVKKVLPDVVNAKTLRHRTDSSGLTSTR